MGTTLDGIPYHKLDTRDLTAGYAEVDVIVNELGVDYPSLMLAGQVAMCVESSGDNELGSGESDTVRPVAGWWMFSK